MHASLADFGRRSPAAHTEDAPPGVRSFLIESERRVIAHCRQMLAPGNLPAELRQPLQRVLSAAEARMSAGPSEGFAVLTQTVLGIVAINHVSLLWALPLSAWLGDLSVSRGGT